MTIPSQTLRFWPEISVYLSHTKWKRNKSSFKMSFTAGYNLQLLHIPAVWHLIRPSISLSLCFFVCKWKITTPTRWNCIMIELPCTQGVHNSVFSYYYIEEQLASQAPKEFLANVQLESASLVVKTGRIIHSIRICSWNLFLRFSGIHLEAEFIHNYQKASNLT